MKRNVLLVLALLVMVSLQAQKIKVADGDLKAFKGIDLFDLSFSYDENMKVGKMTEEEYVKKKMAEAEEAEPGKGEKWKEAWLEDRSVHFEPMFTELLNKYTSEKDAIFRETLPNSEYELQVNTIFIEPGFNIGISRKSASVDLEVTLVKIDDPDNVLVKIMIYGAPGKSMGYGDYDVGIRVGEAYAKAGKELGRFLLKKKVF